MTRAEAVELAVRRHARTRWVGETDWYELAIKRETDMEYTVKAIGAHFRVICKTYNVSSDQHYDGASLRI